MLTAAALLLSVGRLSAQHSFGFAYYDVDRLYDTLPSPFHNDSGFLPDGAMRWDSARYNRKVEQVAALIDSMAVPVVALFGVESEGVVNDIARKCSGYYTCIHRTQDRLDGLDFALLYYSDVAIPVRTDSGRNFMAVETEILGRRFVFLLVNRARNFERLVRNAKMRSPEAAVIAAGDLRDTGFESLGMDDILAAAEARGQGNALFRNGWKMADRIALLGCRVRKCGVYARRWMLDSHGKPAPTFVGTRYRGGSGRRVPVWCEIEVEQ